MPAPLSGEQVEITAGGYRAVVVGLGGGLRLLEHDGAPLVAGYPADALPDGSRGQLLLPWPNRLRGGRWTWDGQERQLPLDEPARGNAIHGLLRWCHWEVAAHAADEATLTCLLAPQPGYPCRLDCSVSYRLEPAGGLTVTLRARADGRPAPVGAGAHPYLVAGTPTVATAELAVPARTRLLLDQHGQPRGRAALAGTELDYRAGRPLGARRLDDCLTDLDRDADGRATVVLRGPDRATELWVDQGWPYLMLYTGDTLADPGRRRRGLAVEPMTSPPGGLATRAGITVLQDGQEWSASFGIRAAPDGRAR